MENMQTPIFQTENRLMAIHFLGGAYFYTFAGNGLRGPYNSKIAACEGALSCVASILEAKLRDLQKLEMFETEIKAVVQDLKSITKTYE